VRLWRSEETVADTLTEARARRKKRIWRVIQIVVSLAIAVGVFAFAIPKVADYSAVGDALRAMTLLELATLFAVMILSIVSYWPQQTAAMPGLKLALAAVVTQTSTSIANTVPGGGVVAVGVSYVMYHSWGFTNSQVALSVLVTGIWNIFMKLGLPVVALALLAVEGKAGGGLLVAAVIGVAVLFAAVVMFALVLWRKEFARRIGTGLGKAASFFRKLIRKHPVEDWGEAAMRFRKQTIHLVSHAWLKLTLSTLISHLALWLVLLLALRHVGVSAAELGTAQVLGVFAFGRLITALPITPGGVGIAELGYIGGLLLAGRDQADVPPEVFRAQVVAAVLVFRTLTYAFQIPLGAFTYLIWRRKKSWLKAPSPQAQPHIAASS
jgi:putative heme transporter